MFIEVSGRWGVEEKTPIFRLEDGTVSTRWISIWEVSRYQPTMPEGWVTMYATLGKEFPLLNEAVTAFIESLMDRQNIFVRGQMQHDIKYIHHRMTMVSGLPDRLRGRKTGRAERNGSDLHRMYRLDDGVGFWSLRDRDTIYVNRLKVGSLSLYQVED